MEFEHTVRPHYSNNKHRKLVTPGGMDRSWEIEKKHPPVTTNGQQESWFLSPAVESVQEGDNDSSPLELGQFLSN